MHLNRDSLPFKDYAKAKRLLWDPAEIKYDFDRQDWVAMSAREQDLVRRALGLFLGGETYVTHDLAPLLIALRHGGGTLEEEMFVTAQLFEESKHVEFFADVLDNVIGDPIDLDTIAGPNYRTLFEDELSTTLGRLCTDHSRAAQADAVVTYHMIVEGVLAETGYYGIFTALRAKGLMPGLLRGLELVQRDEARHIAFGLYLLQRLSREDAALHERIDARINALFPLATGIFTELFEQFLPDLPFDLDLGSVVSYASTQYSARMNVLQRARA